MSKKKKHVKHTHVNKYAQFSKAEELLKQIVSRRDDVKEYSNTYKNPREDYQNSINNPQKNYQKF